MNAHGACNGGEIMYPSQRRTAFAVERSMLNVSSGTVRIVICYILTVHLMLCIEQPFITSTTSHHVGLNVFASTMPVANDQDPLIYCKHKMSCPKYSPMVELRQLCTNKQPLLRYHHLRIIRLLLWILKSCTVNNPPPLVTCASGCDARHWAKIY